MKTVGVPKESGKKVFPVAPVGFPPVTRGQLRRVGEKIAGLPGRSFRMCIPPGKFFMKKRADVVAWVEKAEQDFEGANARSRQAEKPLVGQGF